MKRQTSLLATICISLFFIAPLTATGATPADYNWTWAPGLFGGAEFHWEVTMYNDTGNTPVAVTTPGDDGPPFVNGSQVKVWLYDSPYGLNFENDQNLFSQYFGMDIDGNSTLNDELWPVLVFPNTYQSTTGGDDYNYFHYITDNNVNFTMFDNENNNNTQNTSFTGNNNDTFVASINVFHEDGRNVTESFEFDANYGFLKSFVHHETYTDGTTLEAGIHLYYQDTGSPDGDDDDFFMYASFDSDLNAGDVFKWEFTTMQESGTDITSASITGEAVLGSIAEIRVVGEPENMDLMDPNLVVKDYFELYLDGEELLIQEVFEGVGDFAQFIFPMYFELENGTSFNFFELAASNPSAIWENFQGSASLSDTEFHLQITEQDEDGWQSDMDITFDVHNGVMRHLHRTETNSAGGVEFEMELNRIDDDGGNGGDESSDAGLPLPGFEFYFIIPALVAIPIIKRK